VDGVVVFETDEQGAYRVNFDSHTLIVEPGKQATLDGSDMKLTTLPYRLLVEFIRQPDAYLSAEILYRRVWEGDFHSVKTRAVDFVVCRVRKELPKGWLQSKRFLGWRLLPPNE
jgi:DNA-binding response OmpR family regulator